MATDYHYLKALPEDDGIISITTERIPRWKESELSGDEWRYSYVATLTMKYWEKGGVEILKRNSWNFQDMAAAVSEALRVVVSRHGKQNTFPYSVQSLSEIRVCFQPGCAEAPTRFYRIKQEWTDHPHQGHRLFRGRHDSEQPSVVRAFCEQHHHRGDGDLEDNDDNYEELLAE